MPYAVVSTVIKIWNDANDHDQKSQRALNAIESSSPLRDSYQQWTDKVVNKQGSSHNFESVSMMSMAEMLRPVYQQYVQNARDHLSGEMLQAWVAEWQLNT